MIVSSMRARGTNTRNGKAIEPGVAADSAEAAEEAGLQYVNDERPGYSRKAKGKDFEYLGHGKKNNPRRAAAAPDKTFGHPAGVDGGLDLSAHRMVTFRQRVATRVAASSTAITSAGAKCATKTSSTALLNLPKRCQIFAGELLET